MHVGAAASVEPAVDTQQEVATTLATIPASALEDLQSA